MTFFLAHWQESHTGGLPTRLPVIPIGVTEFQFGLMGLTGFGFLVGPDALTSLFKGSLGSLIISLWVLYNFGLVMMLFVQTLTHKKGADKGAWVAPHVTGEKEDVRFVRAVRSGTSFVPGLRSVQLASQ